MFLLLYIIIALALISIYTIVSYKVVDLITNYYRFKKLNIFIPIKPIMVYLVVTYLGYVLFYIFIVIYTLLSLQPF